MIVELRHGAHGGPRGPHRVGLVDADGGRDPFDAIDLRPVQPVEELPGVGPRFEERGSLPAPLPQPFNPLPSLPLPGEGETLFLDER